MKPWQRRLAMALGMIALAAAIFLEQWCHYQSLPPAPPPPPPPPSMKG